ncbi:OmpA family protein [Sphingomonas sp. SRS2]|uniref:OmpA family protein n=1 Tax=Sphingomonas sp. SRS2 TaxID=133190 RepID=UPI0006184F9C|nr:OmpA family protein [Sphingomonas sp. SRS2]KKC25649.1 membrane protein [Sphingomonas sp. SRS2]
MKSAKTMMAILAASTLLAGCVTNPETGERKLSKAAIGALAGTALGAGTGALVGGKRNRTEAIVGAGIGAIAGGAIGAYMDRQEAKLRQQTAGSGVEIERQGDELLLNMPSGITFATNSYNVQPQFRSTLDKVAATLAEYNQTYVDVYGHTDSTGSDAVNEPLSRNRAEAVSNYLSSHGVAAARIGTQGFGSRQPVASNATADGRQKNRRVEIKIVPVKAGEI